MKDTSAKSGASDEQLRLQAIEHVGDAIAKGGHDCRVNFVICPMDKCECRRDAKNAIEAYEEWKAR